jgi:hypothetical protein
MKMSFHKKPVIDFVLRLTLTIIIISPVIYFSGMPSKGRREVIMSKVWSLFLWLGLPCLYVLFVFLIPEKVINARKSKDESIYHD